VSYFGQQAANPVQFVQTNWAAQQFTGGAFTAVMPPDVWTNYDPALYKPVGRIHWAGTDVATRWPGYFDGAVSAAQSAVKAVLART
jgi:monoamine oxidase